MNKDNPLSPPSPAILCTQCLGACSCPGVSPLLPQRLPSGFVQKSESSYRVGATGLHRKMSLVWLSRHGTLRGKSRQYQPWSRRASDFPFPQLPPASCSVFSWPLCVCVCLSSFPLPSPPFPLSLTLFRSHCTAFQLASCASFLLLSDGLYAQKLKNKAIGEALGRALSDVVSPMPAHCGAPGPASSSDL